MIVLEIRRPGAAAAELFTSHRNVVTIGRHSSNDIRLDDESASRFHAEIERRGEAFFVRDLDSKNGLYINDAPVLEYPLSENDIVAIGETRLTFHRQDPLRLKRDQLSTEVVCVYPDGPDPKANSVLSISGAMPMPDPAQMALAAIEVFEHNKLDKDMDDSRQLLSMAARLCESVAKAIDVDSLLERTLDLMEVTMNFARGVVMLWDSERRSFVPRVSRLREQIEKGGDPEGKIPVSMTIVNHCLERRQGIVCLDAMSDRRFSASQSVHDLKLRSVMCVPIIGSDAPLGVIHLDSPTGSQGLQEGDLPAAMMVANTLASAIQTLLAREDRRRRERRADQSRTLATAAQSLRGLLLLSDSEAKRLRDACVAGELRKILPILDDFLRHQQTLSDTLEHMQDYARGRIRTFVPVDLNTLLRAIIKDQSSALAAKKINLQLTPDVSITDAYFDPEALKQVFVHLITNSIEALEERDEKTIQISTEHVDEMKARIIFQDNGSGMNSHILEHAFDPFFSTRGAGRAGLGLTYAYHIVTMHGGTIDCQSEQGYGTTIVITLPIRSTPPSVPSGQETTDIKWL